MTIDQPAGRALDLRIAELMGWQWFDHPTEDVAYFRPADTFAYGAIANKARTKVEYTSALPNYQGDELEGMRLVDFIHQRGYNVGVNTLHDWDERCECTIYLPNTTGEVFWSASAPTRPRAICLAFLAALAATGEGRT